MKTKSKTRSKAKSREDAVSVFEMMTSLSSQVQGLAQLKQEQRKILIAAATQVVNSSLSTFSKTPDKENEHVLEAVIAAARYLKKEFEDATQPDFPEPTEPETGSTSGAQSDVEAAS